MFRKVLTVLSDPTGLRDKSSAFPEDLSSFSAQDNECIQDLRDTFNVLEGHGLALPQIGIKRRAVVVNFQSLGLHDLPSEEVMINPVIGTGGIEQKHVEACFSVPHVSSVVSRPNLCTVSYISLEGEKRTLQLEGFAAACVQHEVDHLDGVLYIDRLSTVKRSMLLKKAKKVEDKQQKQQQLARIEFEREHRELRGDVLKNKPQRRSKSKTEIKRAKAKRKMQKKSRRK